MKLNIRQLFQPLMALALICTLSACASNQVKHEVDKKKLADIHYQLGQDALGKEGMLPKAFDELMQSDALNPNQPQVLDALAYAWLLRGNMDKSEQFYKKALRHGAGAATQNNYANLLNRMQRFEEAEDMARKSLDDPRYPNQDKAFIILGDALLGQKKYMDANLSYRQAQIFNPNNDMPKDKLAYAYSLQGRLNESAALYHGLVHKYPDNRHILEGLLAVLMKQNKQSEARQVLQNFRNNSNSAMDKAWALDQIGQLE
ncbi:cellulose synthase subunit BcsC [Mariprofundus micogutta]|uniref:Cellulose synthase subunit BcsC n=1 Tax=Mariprofundus micogutta TaxID=1921010 RepID=A0A1L8CLP3_9PROT|nr:hypothetical protein [Mariprofundus micogutta]GAV19824.1 cellulose synthase subunit BcsC [Mariprofundus micogutta]